MLGSLDEVAGEAVGLPLRMRRDDDAVGEEGREGIVDRLEWVGIPIVPSAARPAAVNRVTHAWTRSTA